MATLSINMKLNLGCGDKILEGYVNVDVVADRAGKQPDVQCDLHNLTPFEDNAADEVMAIHVVEHFWRWEIVDVLKEWVRVLKPGGRMVVECPNLISACQAVLADPDNATKPGPEGQRSMWVLYGDPRWRDPLMTHRWAYTPKSLAMVMHQAGFKACVRNRLSLSCGNPVTCESSGSSLLSPLRGQLAGPRSAQNELFPLGGDHPR